MSSVEYLREFVNERLTAAAEEIFGVLKKSIVEYEEEINRQRRLLDIVWKAGVKVHIIDLPQQHVRKEEEVLADQQLCIQERNSSLDQEDPEPPQMNEEQEELCINQEGEQLVLKQEADVFMVTPNVTYEDSDHSEDLTLHFKPDKSQSAAETASPASISISWLKDESDSEISVVSEQNSDQQLHSHNSHVAESQVKKSSINSNNASNPNTHSGKNYLKCDTCGKVFKYQSHMQRHQSVHTGEKPYSCKTCGKRFSHPSDLKTHSATHTGEKPYLCKTCGRGFSQKSSLNTHRTIHTGERPFSCKTCGKGFRLRSVLKAHIRIHTGEKPYPCKTCGKNFRCNGGLLVHMRTHEKPYFC